MAFTVVICGLVRRPDLFVDQLAQLAALRARGLVEAVYWSTWSGEADRYPELLAPLAAAGTVLVEAPEPGGFTGPGHVYLQTAVLRRVVERLAPETLVLKLRPDILFPRRVRLEQVLAYVEGQIARPAVPLGGVTSRIFVGALTLTHPFWLEDRYFAGRAGDLLRLAHSDLDYDHFAHPNAAIAEVRWFSRPFIRRYRALREALRVDWLLGSDRTPGGRGEGFRTLLAHNADLQRLLALYHHVLDRNFVVGLPPHLLSPDRPEGGEPMPTWPDVVAGFAQSSHAGPAYRAAARALETGEDELHRGFADEPGLARALLDLGSALPSAPRWTGPDAYAAGGDAASPGPKLDWGAATCNGQASAGQAVQLAFAWRRQEGRGAVRPGAFDLFAVWFKDGAFVQALDPVRLAPLDRPAGERFLHLSAPSVAGAYRLRLALRAMDGAQCDAVVDLDVTVAP